MEDLRYHSAYYGTIRIRANNNVHNRLEASTVEKLAALIHGAEAPGHLSNRHRGNPGDGAEAYVHNVGGNQIASVKDINVPPHCVTVLNTGKVTKGMHVWD